MTGPPEVIAHRGVRSTHPENTISAFEEAARLSADGIEFDVQLTRDDVPVVIHDDQVDRTTDGAGPVADATARELARLDAGAWTGDAFRGERIPTLERVLQWAHGNTLTLHVEIKVGPASRSRELVRAVVQALRRHDLSGRAVLSSYDHGCLLEARAEAPSLETAILYDFGLHRPWSYVRSVGASAVHCRWDWVDADLVEDARRHDISVRAFGAADASALRSTIAHGVAVITPEPAQALDIRASAHDVTSEV